MALEPVCRVDLSPVVEAPALDDLIETILISHGDDRCGGTLRSLARLQKKGGVAVENLLARPWALDPPYDSRETIREALELWSFIDPWSRRAYLKLLTQIGPVVAETEMRLGAFYPDLSPREGAWLAEEAVWRAFGANYIFGESGLHSLQTLDHIARLYRGDVTLTEAQEINPEPDPTDYALLFAVLDHPDLLRVMLSIVDVDADDGTGKTALMYAAQLDDLALLNVLLDAGADVDAVTRDVRYTRLCSPRRGGLTALHYAAKFAGRTVIERLLEAGSRADLIVEDSSDIVELFGINELLSEPEKTALRFRVASGK